MKPGTAFVRRLRIKPPDTGFPGQMNHPIQHL